MASWDYPATDFSAYPASAVEPAPRFGTGLWGMEGEEGTEVHARARLLDDKTTKSIKKL